MELVGRDLELALCRSKLHVEGHSAGVVIRGDAGVGKTALWRTVTALDWGQGSQTLTATGRDEAVDLPLAGLAELLEPAAQSVLLQLPSVQAEALRVVMRCAPSDPMAPADEGLLVRACINALRALAKPRLMIAIDDEHWLDGDTRRLLALAAAWLVHEPIDWLISLRTGQTAGGLSQTLAHELGPRFTRIDLPPLEEDLVVRLVLQRFPDRRWSPRLLHQVAGCSGGNPYLALEIAQETLAARNETPLSVRVPGALVEGPLHRIDQMSPGAQRLARVAALHARPTRQLLRRVLGAEAEEWLEEAVTADVLSLSPPQPEVSFVHPLIREAVHGTMNHFERQRWHRALAAAAVSADEAAGHLAAAAREPHEGVAATVFSAAQRALLVGAPVRGLALAEAAVALTPDPAGVTAWRRRLLQLDCLIAASEFNRARAAGDAWAQRHVPSAVEGELAARRAWVAQDVGVAIGHLQHAIPLLEHDPRQAALAGTELARKVGVLTMRPREGRRISRVAVRHARYSGDPVLERGALAIDGFLAAVTGDVTAAEQLRAAVELPDLDRMPFPYDSPETRLAMWHMWRGDLLEARQWALLVLAAGMRRGRLESARGTRLQLVEIEWRAGRWESAAEHAALIDAYARESNFGQVGVAAYALSLLAAGRGEVEAARRIAVDGVAAAEAQGDVILAAQCRCVLGQLELSVEDPSAALRWLQPLCALIHEGGVAEPGLIGFVPDLIEAQTHLGQFDAAARHLAWIQSAAEALDHGWARLTGKRAAAVLRLAGQDAQSAVRMAGDSAGEAGLLGLPFEQARSLLVLGIAQRRARQRRAAAHTLDAAQAIFSSLGAARWGALARAQRARLAHASRGTLTASETRVKELVLLGRTNQEIADALLMSVKTVEANLTRIYRKVGVRGRAELIARGNS